MFQHENEIFNLRKLNQNLLYKIEKLQSTTTRKQLRSYPYSNNNSSSASSNNNNKLNSTSSKINHQCSASTNSPKLTLNESSFSELMTNDENSNSNNIKNEDTNTKSSIKDSDSESNSNLINCTNSFFNASTVNSQAIIRNRHYSFEYPNKFNSNSNLDDYSEYDDDIEIANNDLDVFKVCLI